MEERSLAEVMMLPRGVVKFAVVCSSAAKDYCRRHAYAWAPQTKFAHGCDSQNEAGSTSMDATD